MIEAKDILHNEFLSNLGDDHVAVAENGMPIGRAQDGDTIRKANPNAAAYFSADELRKVGLIPEKPKPVGTFDHDGDGRPGGSRPREERPELTEEAIEDMSIEIKPDPEVKPKAKKAPAKKAEPKKKTK